VTCTDPTPGTTPDGASAPAGTSGDETPIPRHAVHVAAGGAHTLAVGDNGAVYTCGLNHSGQTARTKDGTDRTWAYSNLTDIVHVAAGDAYSLAVDRDGRLYGCGANYSFQYAGSRPVHDQWAPIDTPVRFRQVNGGGRHSLAIADNGDLYGVGNNTSGQLRPVRSDLDLLNTWEYLGLDGIVDVGCGDDYSVAVDGNGDVWTRNLGDGGDADGWRRCRIRNVVAVTSTGSTTPCLVDSHGDIHLYSDGTSQNVWETFPVGCGVRAWANAAYIYSLTDDKSLTYRPRHSGQLAASGHWHTCDLTDVTDVAVGQRHAVAVTSDGRLHVTGDNTWHQLGHRGIGAISWITIPNDPDTYRIYSSLCDDGHRPHHAAATAAALMGTGAH
jgi:alpha-tubulin suppressor-like RCC1 family protein